MGWLDSASRSAAFAVAAALAGPLQAQGVAALSAAALENNPAFRVFELRVDEARAQHAQSRSQLLPQITGSANYNWNDFDVRDVPAEQFTGTRGLIQASQALFDLVSYFRMKGTYATVLQSEQRLAAERMNLAGEVVDRFFSLLEASDEIRYVDAEKAETLGQLERLQFMHERQLATVTDLRETEAYYQGLLTREIEATNARDVALEALREITGLVVDDRFILARTEFEPPPGDAAEWVGTAIANNGVLMALEHAIDAARNLIRSNRAGRAPRVALVTSHTYSDQGFDNRAAAAYDVTTVGVQVNIPLFEGGRIGGSVREAVARYEIARQEFEQTRRQIERETRTAFLDATASHARMGSTDSEVAALERVVDAQTKSYELGVSNVVDVLIARRRLYRARVDQLKARYDYIRDLTALRIRAGSLSDAEVARIDGWLQPVAAGTSSAETD